MEIAATPVFGVTAALEQLGIAYCIGGSFASSLYGEPRMTRDMDILVALRPPQIAAFVGLLATDWFIQAEAVRAAAVDALVAPDTPLTPASCNLVHRTTFFKVDCFIARPSGFDQSQLARRVRTVVQRDPEQAAYFASAEDIILIKLVWFAMSHGALDRQWADIRAVIAAQDAQLDRRYLAHWATPLGVTDLLAAVWQTATPPRLDPPTPPDQTRMEF